jgi:lipid A 3-O-deacylase
MKATVMLLSLLLVPLLPVVFVRAEGAKDSSTFTLYVENDVFTGTDSHYTSGVRLAWISQDLADYRENPRLPEWSYPIIERLPFINEPGFQRAVSLSLGQNIYTPEDLVRSDLIEDVRPYAGITYFAIGFHSKSSHRMDSLELDLGIVGPHSYAEQCQTKLHEWIDSTDPQGWDNQLKDEPVFNIFYERKWRLAHSMVRKGFNFDMIPHIGFGLGNVATFASTGTEFRFGWNLPNDFGTFLIRPGSDTNAPLDKSDPRFFPLYQRFGIHVFAILAREYRSIM